MPSRNQVQETIDRGLLIMGRYRDTGGVPGRCGKMHAKMRALADAVGEWSWDSARVERQVVLPVFIGLLGRYGTAGARRWSSIS